jgi:ABC-type nitrate/sulfonate/bicarbonate transport system substrate-binding protein
LEDYGIPDFYSPTLITSESEIKQHPEVVRAFVKATAQGYTYATQHADQSVDMLVNGAGGLTKTLFDTHQVARDSQSYMSGAYIADAKCWGTQTLATWMGFSRLLYHNGALIDANSKALSAEPDYSAMFTNTFLPTC